MQFTAHYHVDDLHDSTMTRQQQSAQGESLLLQAGRDIIVAGVSAADVVDITRAEVTRALGDLTSIARKVAEERVAALADKIFDHFASKPQLLGVFGEPDFQYSLQDAARAAASNDDAHTERLLVDLLANRAEAGNTSRVRLATSHAIRAADKLSVEALNGLTGLWAIGTLVPTHKEFVLAHIAWVANAAQVLDGLPLPSDVAWLLETDVLSLTRSQGQLVTRKPYRQLVEERVGAHPFVSGFSSAECERLLEKAQHAVPDLPTHIVPHPLKPGFYALRSETRDEFLTQLQMPDGPPAELEELIAANGFGVRDPDAVSRFWDQVTAFGPSVSAVERWWNETPYVDLTLVGNVIGFVNAKRYLNIGAKDVSELLGGMEPVGG